MASSNSFSVDLAWRLLFLFTCLRRGNMVEGSWPFNVHPSVNPTLDPLLPSAQLRDSEANFINHYAAIRYSGSLLGAKATISLHGLPAVGPNQTSSALIWLANGLEGPPGDKNFILAGWTVNPPRYGDADTHLTIYWTADGSQNTGCYDLDCKGFIPYKSSKYVPGAKLHPLSTYKGQQYDLTFNISKNNESGDWWLYVGKNGDEPAGFWPKSLFTTLAEVASTVQFGGVVRFFPNEISPPMGNRHFGHEDEGRAAYFKNVTYRARKSAKEIRAYVDKSECYDTVGTNPLYYGGPGGCTD